MAKRKGNVAEIEEVTPISSPDDAEEVEIADDGAVEEDRGLQSSPHDDPDDGEGEDEPEPRRKRGRPPKQRAAAIESPLSLADVVNDPGLNWQDFRLVIYRKNISKTMKTVMKADSGRTWIDRISGPFDTDFDEAHLKANYGGGVFQVYLQQKTANGRKWDEVMEAEYVIAGAPKWTEEEASAFGKTNPQTTMGSGSVDGGNNGMGMIVEMLQRQIDKSERPQAEAMQALADSIRTGQQVSTEMLMTTMKQIIELNGGQRGQSPEMAELLKSMMGMVVQLAEKGQKVEEPKTPMQQLREMMELQQIIQSMQKPPEPGPFDDVAKQLMLRAAENIVPGAAGVANPESTGGWVGLAREILTPLAPHIPALLGALGTFLQSQAQQKATQLEREFQYRARLIRLQQGKPELPESVPQSPQAPVQSGPTPEQIEQMRMGALTQQFVNVLSQAFFTGEDPSDTAITLLSAFPQVVSELQTRLAAYPKWWTDVNVIGFMKQSLPAMAPLLDNPNFPMWIEPVWAELAKPPETVEQEEGK